MKLYHLHNDEFEGEKYVEGNEFTIGGELNPFTRDFMDRSTTYIESSKKENGNLVCYHKAILDLLDIAVISEMSDDEKIKLVETVRGVISNNQIDIRELIMEEVRFKYFPTRPSRQTCMWFSDEQSLPYWEHILDRKKNKSIYEMEVEGNIFVSTGDLIPSGHLPHDIMFEQAMKYWDPNPEYLQYRTDKEYLATGTAKVLRRVK